MSNRFAVAPRNFCCMCGPEKKRKKRGVSVYVYAYSVRLEEAEDKTKLWKLRLILNMKNFHGQCAVIQY